MKITLALFSSLILGASALAENLPACDDELHCTLQAEPDLERCVANGDSISLTEQPSPKDTNACFLKLHLRDKACALGFDSSQFEVVCQYKS